MHVLFCTWPFPPLMMMLRFVYIVVCGDNPFLAIAKQSPVYGHTTKQFFTQLLTDTGYCE